MCAAAFAIAAVPGVLLGVLGADRISRGWFDALFAGLLVIMAGLLVFAPGWRPSGGGATRRTLDDPHNVHYEWSFDMRWGLFGSVIVGVVSALFGIGGGPIQVPFLVAALNYPEHVATATSHAVLATTSLLATIIHAFRGDFTTALGITLSTAFGAFMVRRLAHVCRVSYRAASCCASWRLCW